MTVQNLSLAPAPGRRRLLGRRAQLLAAASVTYNMVEAAVAVMAGIGAGSVALIGFGLDSVVEVSSGMVILWQFRHPMPEQRERRALRLIAVSFFALAAYVTVDAARTLAGASEPRPSALGIAIAAASLAIMPTMSWAQRRTAESSAPEVLWPTPSRPCCAPTCPRSSSAGLS